MEDRTETGNPRFHWGEENTEYAWRALIFDNGKAIGVFLPDRADWICAALNAADRREKESEL